jgi:hypothetical protein
LDRCGFLMPRRDLSPYFRLAVAAFPAKTCGCQVTVAD